MDSATPDRVRLGERTAVIGEMEGSFPDKSSRDDIVEQEDGPVDLYFDPKAPGGKEKTGSQQLPAKG